MNTKNRQQGLSLISWMFVIAVTVFLLLVGVKSLPVYLNHYKVVSIMHNTAAQPGATQITLPEIRRAMEKRFDIDMVKYVDDRKVTILTEPGGKRALALDYEVRVHMFYNVDAVYTFKERVPLGP